MINKRCRFGGKKEYLGWDKFGSDVYVNDNDLDFVVIRIM